MSDKWEQVRPANGRDANAEQLRRRYQKLQSDPCGVVSSSSSSSSASMRSLSTCYILELLKLSTQNRNEHDSQNSFLHAIDADTYIGETNFYQRRIKKHNGQLAGGARKTTELLKAALREDGSAQWCSRVRVEGFPETNMENGKLRKQFEWKLTHELDGRGKGIRLSNKKGRRVVYKPRRSNGIKEDVQQLARVLSIWKRSHSEHNLQVVWMRRVNARGRVLSTGSDGLLPPEFRFPDDDCPYPQSFENVVVHSF